MSFFKNLWSDLVEKRLWPVALVLLVALLAVPVFLGSGGQKEAAVAAVGASGATGALGSTAQVSLDEPGATRRNREGKLRDPFKQPRVPATGATGPAATGASMSTPTPTPKPSSPTPTATPAAPGGPATTGKGIPTTQSAPTPPVITTPKTPTKTTPKTPTKTTPAPPKAPSHGTYVTDLRFDPPGDSSPKQTVRRRTALPTAQQPLLAYLGVLADRKTAVFLLASGVQATGRGTCQPDNKTCDTIELRAGDAERLTITGADGAVTRYALTVLAVRRSTAARVSGAATAHTIAKRKTATKDASSTDDLGSDGYTYDGATGLLRRVLSARVAKLGGHLPGAADGFAADRSKLRAGRLTALPAEGLWGLPEFTPLL